MPTSLIRESLQSLYRAAHSATPHAGLLLQRGWQEDAAEGAKTEYVRKVCDVTVDDIYRRAFHRWTDATADPERFRQLTLSIKSRLFIGTAGGGALETGCAISHSYGTAYIPGSSVKGVVSAHARERFKDQGKQGKAVCEELFGSGPGERHPSGLAGLIGFHDAWWVPDSAESPLVPEVVTSHHPDYYGTDGRTPATDFDEPVPNAQVAVRGAFLFVIEGPGAWLGLAADILTDALHTRGLGAKTRAGYGYFSAEPEAVPEPTCEWVDETIAKLMHQNKASEGDTLRGRQLAGEWAKIEEPAVKREAFEDIRRRWQDEGWWDQPPGRAARAAKAIYLPRE